MPNTIFAIEFNESFVAENLEGFLNIYPNDAIDGVGDPKYTDAQWFSVVWKNILVDIITRGKQNIANEAVEVTPDITNIVISVTQGM